MAGATNLLLSSCQIHHLKANLAHENTDQAEVIHIGLLPLK
jgi:hypothetical protein